MRHVSVEVERLIPMRGTGVQILMRHFDFLQFVVHFLFNKSLFIFRVRAIRFRVSFRLDWFS